MASPPTEMSGLVGAEGTSAASSGVAGVATGSATAVPEAAVAEPTLPTFTTLEDCTLTGALLAPATCTAATELFLTTFCELTPAAWAAPEAALVWPVPRSTIGALAVVVGTAPATLTPV